MSNKHIPIYLFIFCVFLSSGLLAVMIPLSTEQLTQDADVVLIGEVTDVKSYWDKDQTFIYTKAAIYVYRVLVGNIQHNTIDVVYPGGEVGEMGMGVSDQPTFTKGERVLLFLESPKTLKNRFDKNKSYEIVGAAQGKYHIDEKGIAGKGGFSLLDNAEGIIDTHLPAAQLVNKILGKNDLKTNVENVDHGLSGTTQTISRPMYSSHGKWGIWKVPLKLNSSGGPYYGLGGILAGMREWNNVYPSCFEWMCGGATSSKSASLNGVNTVYYTTLGGSTLGYSNWWYSGGKIIETDIRIRSNYSWNFPMLKAVVMHELGHSLGLNHVSNDAIMKVPIVSSRLRLFQDDIDAVTNLYPGANVLGDYNGDGKPDMLMRNSSTGQINAWLMNGTAIDSFGTVSSTPVTWAIKRVGDFNGDGKDDILIKNLVDGKINVWLMNGSAISSYGTIGTLGPDWTILGLADFNGDGNDDILLRSYSDRKINAWLMNGTAISSYGTIAASGFEWTIIGTGDFDGDGKDDILLRHYSDLRLNVWLMNGTAISSYGTIGTSSYDWNIIGLADFNGDGKVDILLRNYSDLRMNVWLMNGTTISSYGTLGTSGLDWNVIALADFNGDGNDDILLRNSSDYRINAWLINGTAISSYGTIADSFSNWKVRGIGDFDNDGKTDLLLRNFSSGQTNVWLLNGVTIDSYGVIAYTPPTWKVH